MTSHYHAVVWLDHAQARIIHFNSMEAETKTVHPDHGPRHLHVKAGSASGTHIRTDPAFYRDVAKACEGATVILLTGPSTAKAEFVAYLKEHAPGVFSRVAGVETLAEVTDPQLLAEGRKFFATADHCTPRSCETHCLRRSLAPQTHSRTAATLADHRPAPFCRL